MTIDNNQIPSDILFYIRQKNPFPAYTKLILNEKAKVTSYANETYFKCAMAAVQQEL